MAALRSVPEHVEALFHGPCALVVGGHDAAGAPAAGWAWGPLVANDPASVRLAVEGDVHFVAGGMLAITGGDLRTSRSVQLKGRIVEVAPPTPEDLYRLKTHRDAFRRAVARNDHVDEDLMDSVPPPPPDTYVSYLVVLEEMYDQSAGPNAGTALVE